MFRRNKFLYERYITKGVKPEALLITRLLERSGVFQEANLTWGTRMFWPVRCRFIVSVHYNHIARQDKSCKSCGLDPKSSSVIYILRLRQDPIGGQ